MILVRNVFRLHFGRAREAKAMWEEARRLFEHLGFGGLRASVDLTGPFYTFVLESTHESLAEWEAAARSEMDAEEWRAWYARFTPLVQSGYREVFTIL